jgi:uncharacterized protein (DUF4415 family)
LADAGRKKPTEALPLRLKRDVVERFKAGGRGWQSRNGAALKQAAGL